MSVGCCVMYPRQGLFHSRQQHARGCQAATSTQSCVQLLCSLPLCLRWLCVLMYLLMYVLYHSIRHRRWGVCTGACSGRFWVSDDSTKVCCCVCTCPCRTCEVTWAALPDIDGYVHPASNHGVVGVGTCVCLLHRYASRLPVHALQNVAVGQCTATICGMRT